MCHWTSRLVCDITVQERSVALIQSGLNWNLKKSVLHFLCCSPFFAAKRWPIQFLTGYPKYNFWRCHSSEVETVSIKKFLTIRCLKVGVSDCLLMFTWLLFNSTTRIHHGGVTTCKTFQSHFNDDAALKGTNCVFLMFVAMALGMWLYAIITNN